MAGALSRLNIDLTLNTTNSTNAISHSHMDIKVGTGLYLKSHSNLPQSL
ncbi:hypothetical protein [Proteus terrae]|nr:hypothetical protein [Proteus terrae]